MKKLALGELVVTRGVHEQMEGSLAFAHFVFTCLDRYTRFDWGDLAPEDRVLNEEAVKDGDGRVLAAYPYPGREDWKIWVITEAGRSVTTILFPDEY